MRQERRQASRRAAELDRAGGITRSGWLVYYVSKVLSILGTVQAADERSNLPGSREPGQSTFAGGNLRIGAMYWMVAKGRERSNDGQRLRRTKHETGNGQVIG
jgi:hypothetical protein